MSRPSGEDSRFDDAPPGAGPESRAESWAKSRDVNRDVSRDENGEASLHERATRPRTPALVADDSAARRQAGGRRPAGMLGGWRQARLSRPGPFVAQIVVATLLTAVVVGALGLGVAQWAAFGLVATPQPTAVDRRGPIAWPIPTATPGATDSSPDPRADANARLQARLNAAMGCADGPPPASSRVIYGGTTFASGAAPPREFALSFDDGPGPQSSPPILDYLERTHTPATFFVMGQYARAWPDLLRREWRDGFAIGVHTWDHPSMPLVPDSQMPHQFGDTLAAIHAAIGQDACVWLWRPPYGDQNPRVVGFARSYGLTTIVWNDDPRDWSRPGPDAIARTLLSEAGPGGIVVMHDGPANREQTAAALPLILDGLRARGLTPVTIPQLLADSHYPGAHLVPTQRRTPPGVGISS